MQSKSEKNIVEKESISKKKQKSEPLAHLSLTTIRRLYIIHDIDVNIIQNHALL